MVQTLSTSQAAKRLIAERIVQRLFRNGLGEQASRLKMLGAEGDREVDLGGWCRGAVLDIVAECLADVKVVGFPVDAAAIKECRRVKGQSQRQAADAIGISHAYLANMEAGRIVHVSGAVAGWLASWMGDQAVSPATKELEEVAR